MAGGSSRRTRRLTAWAATAAAIAARPRLWSTAARQVARLARTGWWRRPPFLPVPDPAWLAFRLETQYGEPAHPPVPADVVAWLRWSRATEVRA